jgi:hypothetical protein
LSLLAFPESTDTLNDVYSLYGAMWSRLTVFAGLGKGAGKTTFFSASMVEARKAGSVGIFTIGLEGGKGKPQIINVMPGDVLITSAHLARAAGASLEILDVMPGRSAIGQLCLCRSVRGGDATLVGPEHISQLASAIKFVCENRLVESALIDGAAGRITQAAALPGTQLLYCAKADSANYPRVAENLNMIAGLADLPLDDGGQGANPMQIKGPLTASIIEGISNEVTCISIETFADCFLDAKTFFRASQRFKIMVRRHIPLLGFVVVLKNIKREVFLEAAPSVSAKAIFNPFECKV